MSGYTSPVEALTALGNCLGGACDRIHYGSFGSGETLPCCPTCLLRIETSGLRVRDGLPKSLVNVSRGCKPLILDVVLNYRQCFALFTGNSAKPRTIDQLTAQGGEIIDSWWDALATIGCCPTLNQAARFVTANDVAPDGQCAGWTMQLEIDVSLCRPCV